MNTAGSTVGSLARLAIDGGTPVFTDSIPPWPHYEPDEIEAAVEVLRSGRVNYWTGPHCDEFETEFARMVDMPYGVSVANGTLALELGLRALGVAPGDEVVTTSRSFFGTITSILAVGARPVFADVDAESGNITAESVEQVLSPRTKAILPVHLGGWPCDMPALRALADLHGLRLLEDCAQAHGATISSAMVGSWGDAAGFSFCQDKIVSTGGEGGMLLLRDAADWAQAWAYKDHGKSYDAVHHRKHGPGYRWLHEGVGSNWRMTEMQAAIGVRQLRKLPERLAARRANAGRLLDRFETIPALRAPRPGTDLKHAHYRVYAYVRPEALAPGWTRERIMTAIVAEGVPCQVGSCSELYREEGLQALGLAPRRRLEVAKELGVTALCFPCHPSIGRSTIEAMGTAVEKVCAAATF